MEHLLIRLTRDMQASWCLATAPGRVMQGTLAEAAHAATGCRVVVLVPTDAITLLVAHIPTRQRQRLRQALPYALEEQLAADVETLHFAAARSNGEGIPCAVVDRATLRGWLDALETNGIKPDVMLPDVLALPRTAGQWTLLAEPWGVRLRSGEMRGIACDHAALPHILPLLLQQQTEQRPTQLRFHDAEPSGEIYRMLQTWCSEQNIELQHQPLLGDALTLFAPHALHADVLNLLQGEFSRREQARQLWRPWRAVATLLAGLLLLQGSMAGARYAALAREDAQLARQIEQVYRSAFPEVQRVVNAPVQMEQKLAELRSGNASQEFHRLLLHAAPKLSDSGITLRALNYAPGLLDIEVTTTDLQTLDRLKQALDSETLRAEITAADNSNGAVAGRIALRGGSR